MSSRRSPAASAAAARASTSSPPAMPSRSLTTLKSSRSTIASHSGSPLPATRVRSASRRRCQARRFGSPDSGSVSASCVISARVRVSSSRSWHSRAIRPTRPHASVNSRGVKSAASAASPHAAGAIVTTAARARVSPSAVASQPSRSAASRLERSVRMTSGTPSGGTSATDVHTTADAESASRSPRASSAELRQNEHFGWGSSVHDAIISGGPVDSLVRRQRRESGWHT